jgi:hypothetical protein
MDQDLDKIFEKYFGKTTVYNEDNFASFQKNLKSVTDEIKRGSSGMKAFRGMLEGATKPMKDVSDEMLELNKAIKKQQEILDKGGDIEKQRTAQSNVRALESQKVELKKAQVSRNFSSAVSNAAVGVGEFAAAIAQTALDMAKGLQAGKEGTEVFGAAAKTAAERTGKLTENVGQFLQVAGGIVSLASWLIPGGAILKGMRVFGAVIAGAGVATEVFGSKLAKLSGEAIQYLNNEIENAKKAFKDMTNTGAQFAGGMTEMRMEAARAGLDMGQFGEVIKNNREELSSLGLGMADAAKRIAGVSGVLRRDSLDKQLQKLGYSFTEQAGLAADVAAQLQASGQLRSMTDEQVAAATVRYGKDLKILSDITGKDAKKAVEKARTEALKAAVYGQLNERQRTALQGVLQGMPEALQKGFLEKIVSGGAAITDVGTNIAMAANSQIGQSFDTLYGTVMAGADSTSEAQQTSLREREKMSASQLRTNTTANAMYTANQLKGGNAGLEGATTIANSLTEIGVKTLPGAADQVAATVESAATNISKLDASIVELDNAAQKVKVILMDKLSTPMTEYAVTLSKGTELLDEAIKRLEDMGVLKKGTSTGTTVGGGEEYQATDELGNPIGFGAGAGGGSSALGRFGNRMLGKIRAPSQQVQAAAADQVKAAGLRVKKGDVTGGGMASDHLIETAKSIQNSLGDNLRHFSSFNDQFHLGLDRDSAHTRGMALDFTLANPKTAKDVAEQIRQMPGVKKVIDEYAKLSAGGTGGHIHVETAMAKGGITEGPSLAGEAGPEAVVPLPDGRTIPVKMDWSEMRETFNEMIRVMKDHKDTSDKMLRASQ